MKARLSAVFALAFVPVFVLALVVTVEGATAKANKSVTSDAVVAVAVVAVVASDVAYQPAARYAAEGRYQEDHPGPASLAHTPGITFLPVSTIHLPLVQNGSSSCSTAPTLISPANGSQLNSLIAVLTYVRGTSPISSTSVYIADNPAFSGGQAYSVGGSGSGLRNLHYSGIYNQQLCTTGGHGTIVAQSEAPIRQLFPSPQAQVGWFCLLQL